MIYINIKFPKSKKFSLKIFYNCNKFKFLTNFKDDHEDLKIS